MDIWFLTSETLGTRLRPYFRAIINLAANGIFITKDLKFGEKSSMPILRIARDGDGVVK